MDSQNGRMGKKQRRHIFTLLSQILEYEEAFDYCFNRALLLLEDLLNSIDHNVIYYISFVCTP